MHYEKKLEKHSIILQERKKIFASGIKEIVTFSEQSVYLFSFAGGIKISGKDLLIEKADVEKSGNVEISGTIDSVVYDDSKVPVPDNFITRLFK